MSKRPADRYPDVAAFADTLGRAVDVVAVGRRGLTAGVLARAFDRFAAADGEQPPQSTEGPTLRSFGDSGGRAVG